MVATCLSPVLVQIGTMPSFTATKPTLRLPETRLKKKSCQDRQIIHSFLKKTKQTKTRKHTPSVHSCRCQGSSLSGQSFSAICLLYSSPILFLMYSWLSSVRCSSNHVVVFTVLAHPANLKGLETDNILQNKKRWHRQNKTSGSIIF